MDKQGKTIQRRWGTLSKAKYVTVGSLVGVIAAGALVAFFFGQSHAQSIINIPNGDECIAKGKAFTNSNITQAVTGYSQIIGMGVSSTQDYTPALELATSQAINGYGAGDYIFVPIKFLAGAYGNQAYVDVAMKNYGFTITDITHPADSPTNKFYASSDISAISGFYQKPNPYSNPDWYGPGQYVHLGIVPPPQISNLHLSTTP